MGAYILRRILLMIPTLFGIMAVSFLVVQFAPGGPVEELIARMTNNSVSATAKVTGSGNEVQLPCGGPNSTITKAGTGGGSDNSAYRGSRGLSPKFLAKINAQFGF